MTPAASIIIPCFNRERFIAECVQSALQQGGQFEVIVVDDGSTDGSAEIVRSFERVRYVHQPNQGASAARNHGARLARGAFLFFLDSDDLMPAGAARAALGKAKRLLPHELALGLTKVIDEEGVDLPLLSDPGDLPLGPVRDGDLFGRYVGSPLVVHRSDAFRRVGGFDEALANAEDHDLALRLYGLGYRFHRVPVLLCAIKVHSGERLSQGSASPAACRRHRQALQRITERLLDLGAGFSREARETHARLLWSAARQLAREQAREDAMTLFALSRAVHPNAVAGRLPIRIMARLVHPYALERASERLKSLIRRHQAVGSAMRAL